MPIKTSAWQSWQLTKNNYYHSYNFVLEKSSISSFHLLNIFQLSLSTNSSQTRSNLAFIVTKINSSWFNVMPIEELLRITYVHMKSSTLTKIVLFGTSLKKRGYSTWHVYVNFSRLWEHFKISIKNLLYITLMYGS